MEKKLCRTAAVVAAAALSEVFPGCELLGGGETDTGFFYQFFYSHPLPPVALSMLEERMRQIIREDRPLREMEMVACSAKELFVKMGHPVAVDALDDCEPKELISVAKLGDFCDLASGPFCSSVREVGAFRVVKLKFLGDNEYRIDGCAFAEKDSLKLFLRKLAEYEENNHLSLGEIGNYWNKQENCWVWTSRGVLAKRELISFLRKSLGGEEIAGSERAIDAYAETRFFEGSPWMTWQLQEKVADPEGDSGFFEEQCQSLIQQKIYCTEKDLSSQLISRLQTIEKTLIILGFYAVFRLAGRKKGEKSLRLFEQLGRGNAPFISDEHGSRAQWIVEDGLGRSQAVVELKIEAKGLRVNVGVERIFALLLEQTSGNLPKTYANIEQDFQT